MEKCREPLLHIKVSALITRCPSNNDFNENVVDAIGCVEINVFTVGSGSSCLAPFLALSPLSCLPFLSFASFNSEELGVF